MASPLGDWRSLGIGKIVLFETEAGTVYALRPPTGAVLWEEDARHDEAGRGLRHAGPQLHGSDRSAPGASSTPFQPTGCFTRFSSAPAPTSRAGRSRSRPRDPTSNTSRGGLRLLRNMLYVPVASYCDGPDAMGIPAEGRLVGVDVTRARGGRCLLRSGSGVRQPRWDLGLGRRLGRLRRGGRCSRASAIPPCTTRGAVARSTPSDTATASSSSRRRCARPAWNRPEAVPVDRRLRLRRRIAAALPAAGMSAAGGCEQQAGRDVCLEP